MITSCIYLQADNAKKINTVNKYKHEVKWSSQLQAPKAEPVFVAKNSDIGWLASESQIELEYCLFLAKAV